MLFSTDLSKERNQHLISSTPMTLCKVEQEVIKELVSYEK